MAVLVESLQPSASGFERLSIGKRNFPIVEHPENFLVTVGLRSGNFTQRLVDGLVLLVPSAGTPVRGCRSFVSVLFAGTM